MTVVEPPPDPSVPVVSKVLIPAESPAVPPSRTRMNRLRGAAYTTVNDSAVMRGFAVPVPVPGPPDIVKIVPGLESAAPKVVKFRKTFADRLKRPAA